MLSDTNHKHILKFDYADKTCSKSPLKSDASAYEVTNKYALQI